MARKKPMKEGMLGYFQVMNSAVLENDFITYIGINKHSWLAVISS